MEIRVETVRIEARQVRRRLIFNVHWSAVNGGLRTRRRFAVDSWLRDNGQPPLVQPLGDWLRFSQLEEVLERNATNRDARLVLIGLYREQSKLEMPGLHLNRLPDVCPDDPAVQELQQEMNL